MPNGRITLQDRILARRPSHKTIVKSRRFKNICQKWDDYTDWIYSPKPTRSASQAFKEVEYTIEESRTKFKNKNANIRLKQQILTEERNARGEFGF